MHAARLHEIGGKLQLDEVDPPVAGEGEVIVDLAYASVNPLDIWVTMGSIGAAGANLPWTPGTEASGTLDGAPVLVRGAGLGVLRPGLYRGAAAVPRECAIALPAGVDLEQAAAIGVAGMTAHHAVHRKAAIGSGDRVLVLGASGGVGSVAVQLAKAAGATVWGQTGSAGKAASIGADHTVVCTSADLADAVAELAPTVVLDGLGGPYTGAAVQALSPNGRLVIYGTSSAEVGELNLRTLYRKGLTVHGYAGLLEDAESQRTTLEELFALLASGAVKVATEVLPLGAAADAHRRLLDRQVTGKLLLDCRS